MKSAGRWLYAATAVAATFAQAGDAAAAVIQIVNDDGPNEGLNDPAAWPSQGGNPATTLGQARLTALQRAADVWGAQLVSAVPILIRAKFDPIGCGAMGAVLASAGSSTLHENFPNTLVSGTWYPQALANSLAGADLAPGVADISANFNTDVDSPTCLGTADWYYGLDANAGGDFDLVNVALHELGHGLGFITFVDPVTGAKLLGRNDVYMLQLEQHGAGIGYANMTDAQRAAAHVSDPNLHWIGSDVTSTGQQLLSAGVSNGHVRMFGPNPVNPGSSISHFSTALSPNELMEPAYTNGSHDLTLTLQLFRDIGWQLASAEPAPAAVPSVGVSGSFALGGLLLAAGARVRRRLRTPSRPKAPRRDLRAL